MSDEDSISNDARESLWDDEPKPENEDAMKTQQCLYCSELVDQSEIIPAVDDDVAWAALAVDHRSDCEWILTRALRTGMRE